ncbi:MAG: hypothetical protein IE923_12025, partial [Micrococcales bacterium]|nr:hypothetical protein [Micrococcales bacterium]
MSTEPRPVGAAHRSPAPAPARTRARPARPLPAFTAATAGAGLLLAAAAGLGVPRLDAGVAAVLLTATAAVAGVACLVTGVLALRRALGRWALVAAPLWLVVLPAGVRRQRRPGHGPGVVRRARHPRRRGPAGAPARRRPR